MARLAKLLPDDTRDLGDPRIQKKIERCRKKFLRHFPGGFHGEKYVSWERDYKWQAHERWMDTLNPAAFRKLLAAGKHQEIAQEAARIEGRTNLLFSFEKMALRDAIRDPAGARSFSRGLYEFLHGKGGDRERFEAFVEMISGLPRKKTRVLTWPLATVFGFIAQPDRHLFLKPNVTRYAAEAYGYDFHYKSKVTWEGYESLLGFAAAIARDQAALKPRDMIDLQSFIWVLGSDEYP